MIETILCIKGMAIMIAGIIMGIFGFDMAILAVSAGGLIAGWNWRKANEYFRS